MLLPPQGFCFAYSVAALPAVRHKESLGFNAGHRNA